MIAMASLPFLYKQPDGVDTVWNVSATDGPMGPTCVLPRFYPCFQLRVLHQTYAKVEKTVFCDMEAEVKGYFQAAQSSCKVRRL